MVPLLTGLAGEGPCSLPDYRDHSFAISVVHSMLSGTASMDFGGRKAVTSATGMFDGMQYIGGATVG